MRNSIITSFIIEALLSCGRKEDESVTVIRNGSEKEYYLYEQDLSGELIRTFEAPSGWFNVSNGKNLFVFDDKARYELFDDGTGRKSFGRFRIFRSLPISIKESGKFVDRE